MQISRRDLYNRVWSTPMIKLARELDISDVGLAKACRRYNIPRPPRGYWAKLAAGKASPKPGLPPSKIDTVEFDAARHRIPTPPKVEVDPASIKVAVASPGEDLAGIPERHAQRVDLARGFAMAIFAGKSTALPDGSSVRISEFDPAVLGDIPNGVQHSEVRATIDQVSETRNRQTVVVGTHAGGALALTLQSSQDDALLKAIFDTLSDSARRQFSGTRGAMFLVGLHGLGGDQLFSVAQQDQDISQTPTALRIAVSRFLNGEGRDHVVGVGFLSESGLQPLEAGLVESGGTAYYFPKRESPNWSDDFSGLFTWNHPSAQPGADGLGSSP